MMSALQRLDVIEVVGGRGLDKEVKSQKKLSLVPFSAYLQNFCSYSCDFFFFLNPVLYIVILLIRSVVEH